VAGVSKTDWIWMDGEFVRWEDATVHVLTHTLHYGFGIFEGTRAYQRSDGGTSVFRLDDHLGRLANSAHIMQLEMPYSLDELRGATLEMVSRNQLNSCYIRHLVYIGQGTMGIYPGDDPVVKVAVTSWPWGAYLGEEGLAHGVRCKISSYARPNPTATMTKAKAVGNYVNSILAKREAVALGFHEALLMDSQGNVAEGSGENLFMVRNGVVTTPPLNSVLEGITRRTMMELAEMKGHQVVERTFTRDEVYTADELFMTGTAAEVTPIREVDHRLIADGEPGPITRDLQATFFAVVAGEVPEKRHWLVDVPPATPDSKPAPVHEPASA
jgi:branched-chain amino acid aminotransferase